MGEIAFFVNPENFSVNPKPVRVVLADDNKLFTRGIAELLNEAPGTIFCASFLNGLDLRNWYDGANADILLIDAQLPILDGIETSKHLLAQHPQARIIILSVNKDPAVIKLLRDVGVRAYLSKTTDPDDLIQAILKVHGGEKVFPENFDDGHAIKANDVALKISTREVQVLVLIAKGKTNKQIAEELHLSMLTVKKHRENLLYKFKASNTAQLISNAIFKGLL